MTYETFDNFLTLVLTVMIYGTGLWLAIAFPLFVVRRELSTNPEEKLEPNSTQAIAQSDVGTKTEAQQLQPAVIAEFEEASTPIVSEPVDFRHWKVADLRRPKLRQAFDVPLRPAGQSRPHSKSELVGLYMAAMSRICTSDQPTVQTLHLVSG